MRKFAERDGRREQVKGRGGGGHTKVPEGGGSGMPRIVTFLGGVGSAATGMQPS